MQKRRVLGAMGLILPLLACGEPVGTPSTFEAELRMSSHGTPANFGTPLSGAEEVPPVATNARGNVIFQLSRDGARLEYKLIVANIEDVTQAHIHCGSRGVNGPIILWLYPSAPPAALIPGRTQGILGQGSATDDDVVARPSSEVCPGGVADLSDVVEKLRSGGAYANVHTSAHPAGEVRGQIEARGSR